MKAIYRRSIVVLALLVIFVMILADHLSSNTFAFNTGDRSVDTVLKQRQQGGKECSPCAPCPQ
jgi:hypothetical protein